MWRDNKKRKAYRCVKKTVDGERCQKFTFQRHRDCGAHPHTRHYTKPMDFDALKSNIKDEFARNALESTESELSTPNGEIRCKRCNEPGDLIWHRGFRSNYHESCYPADIA